MSSSKLAVGIVGMPNVGKSTLFNALLKKQQALAANYPFATIEPNIGVVPVPDQRLDFLAETIAAGNDTDQIPNIKQITNSKYQFRHQDTWPPIVPATVEFYDIAGLVKGASEGEGLGNQFLGHIREVDAIVMVLRAFTDANVIDTGSANLQDNLQTVLLELVLADLATLEKQREPRGTVEKEAKARFALVQKLLIVLAEGKPASSVPLNPEEQFLARELHLLTHKPVLYVINVGEEQLVGEDDVPQGLSTHYAQILGVAVQDVVVISAKLEAELADLNEDEQVEYLTELGIDQSGLERLIGAAYAKLGLISFLTAGEKEVRAWTIQKGMTAQEAAGVIHTDFAKNFIKAEVVPWERFVELGGWKQARDQGKVRQEGRDYLVTDGDVVLFRTSA